MLIAMLKGMLITIIYYIFVWWFAKLTNKKPLIVRAVLASCLSIFFLSGSITMFMGKDIFPNIIFGIIFLIITLLFGLRAGFDIKKILTIKNNPSDFAKQQIIKKQYENPEKQYKPLIEKCGARFFIKYYKQIKSLPMRDVNITENYSTTEKEERLRAAKKIIDSNLSEFALNEIIKTYSNILDGSEVMEARKLLVELQIESHANSFYPPLR